MVGRTGSTMPMAPSASATDPAAKKSARRVFSEMDLDGGIDGFMTPVAGHGCKVAGRIHSPG